MLEALTVPETGVGRKTAWLTTVLLERKQARRAAIRLNQPQNFFSAQPAKPDIPAD
jgi:hypothetical protein